MFASEKDEEGEHLIHEEVCDLCRSHDVECGAIGCCTVSEGEYSLRFSEN